MQRLAIAVGAVAVLAVGGVAFAQTSADERIYACVNNGDGTMRQVAGPDVACAKNWHKLSWSSESPPAPTTYRRTGTAGVSVSGVNTAQAFCDDGDIATGGGYENAGRAEVMFNEVLVSDSLEPIGWQVTAFNGRASAVSITAEVLCLDVAQ